MYGGLSMLGSAIYGNCPLEKRVCDTGGIVGLPRSQTGQPALHSSQSNSQPGCKLGCFVGLY